MAEHKSKEKNEKRPKPDDMISLKLFSATQQAKITLAADKKGQSIGKFMGECVVHHIEKMVTITFSEDPIPSEV